ncbi:MAG TPA: ATP-binding protein [Terriglobales bacterium]|nr:ATP-binding protein [Terriglobales bacterium]
MFLKPPRGPRGTAAWRISIWTTLAFAFGSALAFWIVYLLVEKGVRERSDAWLSGEAQTLAEVSQSTPPGNLYDRIVEEVAELATNEVPHDRNARGQQPNSVFFLQTDSSVPDDTPIWVGPDSRIAFQKAIQQANLTPGTPESIQVEGYPSTFRVVVRNPSPGKALYLGLADQDAMRLLHQLTDSFLMVWGGTVVLGFFISYASARRTLMRVEQITETVARIGSEELDERLPESPKADEISRLAQTFNHMLDRIQASVHQLRAVTDSVAHDLKSPVTSIRGRLEAALSDGDPNRLEESVGEAIEGLDRLSDLLNTTLDLAEAEAGALRLDRTPVDLTELITRLSDIYQPAMAERRHTLVLDLEDHVVVNADPGLMNRTLSNLLENELTHLPEGCEVKVRLRAHDGAAELVILDNGPGFPPEIGSRAFERFVKGKHSPGHGLGLAFVDAVVQAHGGKISIADSSTGDAVVQAHGGKISIADSSTGGALITLSLPLSALQSTAV